MTDQELAELQDAHPDWHLWFTDCRTPMATRRNTVPDTAVQAGLARTLMGGRYEVPLPEQLAQQVQREQALAAQPTMQTASAVSP